MANILIIENITGPDIGSIKCIGENMAGRVQDESTIQIAGKHQQSRQLTK